MISPERLRDFIAGLPKAELHVHIEGTLEPEMLLSLSRRNRVPIRFATVADAAAAYRFNCLQDFLDIYYEGAGVLVSEADFYELTRAYLRKAAEQNIRRCEIFFDPQTHTRRGVPFDAVINGIHGALTNACPPGVSAGLIMCFLRDLDPSEAMVTLALALPHRDKLIGIGLDSAEVGYPPSRFAQVFAEARRHGLRGVAHAGEEGPPAYVRQALDRLHVSRIDHGNRAEEDPELMAVLARRQVPLTLCPLSNLKLGVVADLAHHPLKTMLEGGLCVTVNSDDPAYFGGYLNENFLAIATAQELSRRQLTALAQNAVCASFLPPDEKNNLAAEVDAYARSWEAAWL